jgi:hypothetical protein
MIPQIQPLLKLKITARIIAIKPYQNTIYAPIACGAPEAGPAPGFNL